MIFWGRKNIAGKSSLKIPYGTIAVNTRIDFNQEHIQISYIGLNFWSTYSNQKQATIQNVECSFNGFKPYLAVVSVHFLLVLSMPCSVARCKKGPPLSDERTKNKSSWTTLLTIKNLISKVNFLLIFDQLQRRGWQSSYLPFIIINQSIITYTQKYKVTSFKQIPIHSLYLSSCTSIVLLLLYCSPWFLPPHPLLLQK